MILSMTLEKLNEGTFERYPYLTPEEVEKNEEIEIVSEPKTVIVRKTNKPKIVVDVMLEQTLKNYTDDDALERAKTKRRTWFMNHQTSNYLIDILGSEEKEWIGKKVNVETLTQVISGKKHKVIYAKGCIV